MTDTDRECVVHRVRPSGVHCNIPRNPSSGIFLLWRTQGCPCLLCHRPEPILQKQVWGRDRTGAFPGWAATLSAILWHLGPLCDSNRLFFITLDNNKPVMRIKPGPLSELFFQFRLFTMATLLEPFLRCRAEQGSAWACYTRAEIALGYVTELELVTVVKFHNHFTVHIYWDINRL